MKVIVNNHRISSVNLIGEHQIFHMTIIYYNRKRCPLCPLKSVNLGSIWFEVHLFDDDNSNDDDGGGSDRTDVALKRTPNRIRFCGASVCCCRIHCFPNC